MNVVDDWELLDDSFEKELFSSNKEYKLFIENSESLVLVNTNSNEQCDIATVLSQYRFPVSARKTNFFSGLSKQAFKIILPEENPSPSEKIFLCIPRVLGRGKENRRRLCRES